MAPVPVLILSLAAQIDFEKPVNVLLCDTLGGEGWQVLESGLQFARALDTRKLFHAHILKASKRSIQDARSGFVETSINKKRIATENLERSMMSRIREELLYRFHSTLSSTIYTDRYHAEASIGDLDAEIFRLIDQNQCDLVIIGREQFLSRNNIVLDRIPYRALLERKIGLLVLPDFRPGLPGGIRSEVDKMDVLHGLAVE
jgi:hypothetical protein